MSSNFYVTVQNEVLKNDALSERAKLLYAFIASLSHQKGYCFATNKFFASNFKVSKSTINRHLAELKNANYVRMETVTEENGNRLRYIYPLLRQGSTSKTTSPPCQERRVPHAKDGSHNNKRNMKNNISYESNYGIDWGEDN